MPRFILILVILFAISGLLIPVNSIHAKSEKDTLTIHTVWVTGNKSCYHNDVQRMNEYNEEIVVRYLQAYGLDLYYYNPTCMTESEYKSYQSPDYTDLVIVVYNKNVGRDVLHAKNMGGFFQWSDMKNKNALKIEVCECPTYDYNDPVWVLSHELAHFALYYLGYDRDIFEGYVHAVQSRYYMYCPDGDTTSSKCDGLWEKYEGYTRNYKMMKVYPGATSVNPPQAKFVNFLGSQSEPIIKFEKQTTQTNKKYPVFTFQQKQILNKEIDSASISVLNLKTGLDNSWNYLIDARKNYHTEKAQSHVDKAWAIYNKLYAQRNSIDKDLSSLVSNYLSLENAVNSYRTSHYNEYTEKLKKYNAQATQIGSDMKYISQELEYAKKAEGESKKYESQPEKRCILFWCS